MPGKPVKITLTYTEAREVLYLLRRWNGTEPARDRAEKKIEKAILDAR